MGILKGFGYVVASIIILGVLIGIGGILAVIGMASGAIFLGLSAVVFIALFLKELFEKKDDSSG